MNELTRLIKDLIKDDLSVDEIASAFNMLPSTVRSFRNEKAHIDKIKFEELWKNGLPYSVIANHFGVTPDSCRAFKSQNLRGVTKIVICYDCGHAFETEYTSKGLCPGCLYEHRVDWIHHKQWQNQLKEGDRLAVLREDKKYDEEQRKLLEEIRKKDVAKPWWSE